MHVLKEARDTCVYDASELDLLGRVFSRLKKDGQSLEQREALASRIIANYTAGMIDEEELIAASQLPLGR